MTTQRVTVTATRTFELDTEDYKDFEAEGEEEEDLREPTVDEAMAMLKEGLEDGSNDLSEFFESASIEVVRAD